MPASSDDRPITGGTPMAAWFGGSSWDTMDEVFSLIRSRNADDGDGNIECFGCGTINTQDDNGVCRRCDDNLFLKPQEK